jgi:hypothetical protein
LKQRSRCRTLWIKVRLEVEKETAKANRSD